MSKTPSEESHNSNDELLAEYHFDYQKAKPNRFAGRSGKQQLTVVVLDGRCGSSIHNTRVGQQGAQGLD